jgi:hypothetical protein
MTLTPTTEPERLARAIEEHRDAMPQTEYAQLLAIAGATE